MAPETRAARSTPRSSILLDKLTPELFDLVLSFLLPNVVSGKKTRQILTPLLSISPHLTPIIRRRLYRSITFHVGSPTHQDERTLALLEQPGIATSVRYLQIGLPPVNPTQVPFEDLVLHGPAAAIIASEKLPQIAVMAQVTNLLTRCRGLLALSLECRVGCREEGRSAEVETERDERDVVGRDQYCGALRRLDRLERLALAVPSRVNALQILASVHDGVHWQSPLVTAFVAWPHLTSLDLWRVSIALPDSAPPPTFALQSFSLTSSSLGAASDLFFFLGDPTKSQRSARLQELRLKELDFQSAPSSSDPLLALFTATAPFLSSLKTMHLHLHHPLTANVVSLLDTEPSTKVGFGKLLQVAHLELGGSGFTDGLFRTFKPIFATSRSLTVLDLTYLPNVSMGTIVDVLRSGCAALQSLNIKTSGTFLRNFGTGVAPPLPDWTLSKAYRHLLLWAKSHISHGPDGSLSLLVVSRNGLTVDLDKIEFRPSTHSGAEDVNDSDEEEDDEDEEGSEWDEDPNAEFVPSSEAEGEAEAEQIEWLERRRRAAEEGEGLGDSDGEF